MDALHEHFQNIRALIQQGKTRALMAATIHELESYWYVGAYLSQQLSENTYGKNVVNQLAEWLQEKEPRLKGFDRRSLYRMRDFFEHWSNADLEVDEVGYKQNKKLISGNFEVEKIVGSVTPQLPEIPALLTRISWSHHVEILRASTSPEEMFFYLILCIKDRYTTKDLRRQIKSGLFERQMLSKQALVLPEHPKKALLPEIFRDRYLIEFLDLRNPHTEFELKKALVANMKTFLLELGRDFMFLEEEMHLKVGMNDYFVDLVFYHRELQCLVAFDLKIEDFKPEHLGKMNFYLELLDRDVKKPQENPSIGVLLCKSKNQEVVEIALSRQLSPTLVSVYETKFLDKKLLQRLLHEWTEIWEQQQGEGSDNA